jgi:hypothetical protein
MSDVSLAKAGDIGMKSEQLSGGRQGNRKRPSLIICSMKLSGRASIG